MGTHTYTAWAKYRALYAAAFFHEHFTLYRLVQKPIFMKPICTLHTMACH